MHLVIQASKSVFVADKPRSNNITWCTAAQKWLWLWRKHYLECHHRHQMSHFTVVIWSIRTWKSRRAARLNDLISGQTSRAGQTAEVSSQPDIFIPRKWSLFGSRLCWACFIGMYKAPSPTWGPGFMTRLWSSLRSWSIKRTDGVYNRQNRDRLAG